jgi:hypothetical protein
VDQISKLKKSCHDPWEPGGDHCAHDFQQRTKFTGGLTFLQKKETQWWHSYNNCALGVALLSISWKSAFFLHLICSPPFLVKLA